MAEWEPGKIRNVVLLSHSGAGKTSLAEAMLFDSGATNRLGRIDEGTTIGDFDQDEIKHKISLNLKVLPVIWKGTRLNIIDTPGYADFAGEVKAGLRVAESAVIAVSAVAGLEVGTEQAWQYCETAGLPRLFFVNKMDRENASFEKCIGEIQAKFGKRCLPLQLPIGVFKDFKGVIDLLTLTAYTGQPARVTELPPALAAEARSWRDKLVESVAETDDTMIEEFLAGEEIPQEQLLATLRQAVVQGELTPILVGSALQNEAVDLLLDAMAAFLPTPLEHLSKAADGAELKPSLEAPLVALVFKTTADPYVGKLTYLRVYSGTIASNSQIWNVNHSGVERIGQLFSVRGKTQEPVNQVAAGNIGTVAKLTLTGTGDTLASQAHPVKLAPIDFPLPSYSAAVYPKSKADVDKLGNALSRLVEEDLTLHVQRDPATGETVISGLGETQLAVVAERMMHKFSVAVELKPPKVPYRETIMGSADADYKHKKQTGGHGQYGHVVVKVEPGEGIEFVDAVVGGHVPRNFIPAVEKGVREAAQEGVLAGFPLVNVKVTLIDGSSHPVDSSEMAFKIAGAGALKKGLQEAQPMLLEPVMNLKVTVPKDSTGAVIGDLNTKRAQLHGVDSEDDQSVITAQVPLAEVLRYSIDLKSMTGGRGHHQLEFSHYQQVPAHIVQHLVAERQAEEQAEKI